MSQIYIGVMSGTSLDGADISIVEFEKNKLCSYQGKTYPFPKNLSKKLFELRNHALSLESLGRIDKSLGFFFSKCIKDYLTELSLDSKNILAIGFSGLTIYHKPSNPEPFTMQIGDPNIICKETKIDVASDFRRADMALNGEGAPLTPGFHKWYFGNSKETRVILNLGGIANITILEPGKKLVGFDTGPANTLIDCWSKKIWDIPYDEDGRMAKNGNISNLLLNELTSDSYFSKDPPKSTGTEYFNLNWLNSKLDELKIKIEDKDILRTLTQLTVDTISDSIERFLSEPCKIILCGGGVSNIFLVNQLKNRLNNFDIYSSQSFGLDPNLLESIAFAWLAKQRVDKIPSNVPSVTGAKKETILGSIYSK